MIKLEYIKVRLTKSEKQILSMYFNSKESNIYELVRALISKEIGAYE